MTSLTQQSRKMNGSTLRNALLSAVGASVLAVVGSASAGMNYMEIDIYPTATTAQ